MAHQSKASVSRRLVVHAASATLIESHERRTKEKAGLSGR